MDNPFANLKEAWSDLSTWLRDLYSVLWHCWFIILMLVIATVVFILVPQGRDIIRAQSIAEAKSCETYFNIFASFITVTMWAIQSWYCGRVLLHASQFEVKNPERRKRIEQFEKWIPRILGMLPFVVMIFAFYSVKGFFHFELAIYLILLIIFYKYVTGRRVKQSKLLKVRLESYDLTWEFVRKHLKFIYISLAFYTIVLIIFIISTVTVPQYLGTGAVVTLALATWITEGCLLVYLDKKSELPLVLIFILMLVLFSRINNNHFVRITKSTEPKPEIQNLENHFEGWLNARKDKFKANEPYPVFFVAAEGGGLRAAYWTAGILSAIRDEKETFPEHIYAISGVSGGTLGAAVFLSLESEFIRRGKSLNYQDKSRKVLSEDFLSPVTSTFLYPDLLQTILPFPIARFDRSLALEEAFERAWDLTGYHNYFSNNFLELWPVDKYRLPAFFLNITRVEDGERAFIGNVQIGSEICYDEGKSEDNNEKDNCDLGSILEYKFRLSSAVLNSARFPYITPAVRIFDKPDKSYFEKWFASADEVWGHAADGGYFENSGAATIFDIISALEKYQRKLNIVFYVVMVRNDPISELEPMLWLNTLADPPVTLLKTRSARVLYSIQVIKNSLGADKVITLNMDLSNDAVPVGWALSEEAKKQADDFINALKISDEAKKIYGLLDR